MTNDNKNNFRILIVDDVPQNIQVLANILKEAGYQTGFARDAKTALSHLEATPYDLILLDIMMPEIDGYQLCSQLKQDKRQRDIPVIFITAKSETLDKTRGFELGAVDYITKPFDIQEVVARVKTHLTIRHYATKLEQMVEERTRQLIHADRLATLGTFSAALVHEINSPLSYIIGNAELLQLFWEFIKPIVKLHTDEDENLAKIHEGADGIEESIKYIMDGCYRISKLIKSLKRYSRHNKTQREKSSLREVINDALNLVGYKVKFNAVIIDLSVSAEIYIFCDQQQMSQVFVNLIGNACDAMQGHCGGQISINATTPVDNQIEVRIADNGPGIPDETGDKIFDPFFTTKGKDDGTGLGLFIVRNIIQEHKGKIFLSPFNGKGAEFRILLPLA